MLAFQGWRRFKESFAPEIVEKAVQESQEATGRRVRTCIDPFGGSGTTALACQFLGIRPTTIEVNPYLADLIEAKLALIDVRAAAREFSRMLQSAPEVDATQYFRFAPATFVEPGVKGRHLFSQAVAQRIASLSTYIENSTTGSIKRLLKVLLASAVLEVCNATVSGKGRRYRRNWSQHVFSSDTLDRAYMRLFSLAAFDLSRYGGRPEPEYRLLRGDSRLLIRESEDIDLAIFSPPYPNSFDYTDVYNIELWALGYLKTKSENVALRNETLRSHVQITRDFSSPRLSSQTLSGVVERLEEVGPSLWNKNIPVMIGAYFADMSNILSELKVKLTAGGRVYAVVGDSCYAGIGIPVATIVSEMAPSVGYRVVSSEPFRSMRLSPQQGGDPRLAESLVVLASA
jgi:hypothetical protein